MAGLDEVRGRRSHETIERNKPQGRLQPAACAGRLRLAWGRLPTGLFGEPLPTARSVSQTKAA